MQRQHDITWFELDFPNLKNINPKFQTVGKSNINYLLLGSLFIGNELFGVVEVKTRYKNPNYYTTSAVRIYLINMQTKKHHGYIEYLDGGSISLYDRLIIHKTMDVLSPSLPKKSEYTVYAITNSCELKKIKEFALPIHTSYICENNTFIYLDAKNNFAGFRYLPDSDSIEDLYAENPILSRIPDSIKSSLVIDSNSIDDKHIIIEYYEGYDSEKKYEEGNHHCYLFDIREWPPKFISQHTKNELMPCFDGNYINSYIGEEHNPITILNTFPDIVKDIPDEDIAFHILDFQKVQRFCRTTISDTLQTYEIVIAGFTTGRKPICGYDINTPAAVKIINTHIGEIVIDGGTIFKIVEDEYRKTLTRMKIPSSNYTSAGLETFIHPFGRLIYSKNGCDGILELNNNRTKYNNIIQGFYIFVLLNNKQNNGTGEQSYRIKVIGYYPKRVGGIKHCQVSDDEFVYHSKFYDREQTQTASLTLFYSSFVRRMRSRFDKALLGYQPDLIIDNISRFYVINNYREDIYRINSRNDIVPLLGL
jgi:hypothetical protein